ncbi:unnamed protein product [Ectocarpus sp. 12 AP-2014]
MHVKPELRRAVILCLVAYPCRSCVSVTESADKLEQSRRSSTTAVLLYQRAKQRLTGDLYKHPRAMHARPHQNLVHKKKIIVNTEAIDSCRHLHPSWPEQYPASLPR